MTSRSTLSIRAHAKVNLDLRVLGRRPDGFHEIRTIFQTLALHDTLRFEPAEGPLALTCTSPEVPADPTNLVWRAARALWRAAGRRGEPRGVSIRIRKRIPTRAGLGGGSSDAAAALTALSAWWHVKLPARELLDLAAALGSDVPFFLLGGTALGLGRGDALYPLPSLPSRVVVVARPREGVSTAEAYVWLAREKGRRSPAAQRLEVPWPPGAIDAANDFEPVVLRRVASAARLRRALLAAGAELAMLSGSGSAVFGVFRSASDGQRAAAGLKRMAEGVWLTRFAGRRPRRPASW